MIATYPQGRHLLPEERLWKAVLWRAFDDCTYLGYERTLIVAKNEAIREFISKALVDKNNLLVEEAQQISL